MTFCVKWFTDYCAIRENLGEILYIDRSKQGEFSCDSLFCVIRENSWKILMSALFIRLNSW